MLLSIVLALSGCELLRPPGGQIYAVGTVRDYVLRASGEPIPGAQVLADVYDYEEGRCNFEAEGAPMTSFDEADSAGAFRIRLRDLIRGERCVRLRVRASGTSDPDTIVDAGRITLRYENERGPRGSLYRVKGTWAD